MSPATTKSALPPARRRLVELMQSLCFGQIENLVLRGGQPTFDPEPRVVHEIKFGGENGPRSELAAGDFRLKSQVIELFQHFDRLGDAVIERIEVKHGLPFRLIHTNPSG
jgi:hypothetical protein